MKWTRSGVHSTGYIGVRHYITITHIGPEFYEYVYVENGSRVFHASVKANSWNEAEQNVVRHIRYRLSCEALYWNDLLNNFDKETNSHEKVS